MGADFGFKFLIEHVAFGYGENPLFVHQLGIETAQFFKQDFILRFNVVGIGRNHKEQHGVALDMAQEPQP